MSELDKVKAVQTEAGTLSEFLDWLEENGYTICKWQDYVRHSEDIGDYTPEGYYPVRKSFEQLLADFFEIDLKKVEEEKQKILDDLQRKHG